MVQNIIVLGKRISNIPYVSYKDRLKSFSLQILLSKYTPQLLTELPEILHMVSIWPRDDPYLENYRVCATPFVFHCHTTFETVFFNQFVRVFCFCSDIIVRNCGIYRNIFLYFLHLYSDNCNIVVAIIFYLDFFTCILKILTTTSFAWLNLCYIM